MAATIELRPTKPARTFIALRRFWWSDRDRWHLRFWWDNGDAQHRAYGWQEPPEMWMQALLFVALARLGQVFGLLAELRFWAACGALPGPFDRLGITPLGSLGADVWPVCEDCGGRGEQIYLPGIYLLCRSCAADEPTRVDDVLMVLDDWRRERGVSWSDVVPRLTVFASRTRPCRRRQLNPS